MFKEFKEFAVKGNLIDMAVGITIGAAFGAFAASFVSDIFGPPLGLLLGGVDFNDMFVVLRDGASVPPPYATLAAAKAAGAVTLNYGLFLNALINFLIVAMAMFVVVKAANRLRRQQAAAAAEPPAPTTQEKLLMEIRDLLKRP